jgi:6,7-dimethyl-8-ribityllumazine synthase
MADLSNSRLKDVDAGVLDVEDACVVLVRTDWNASIVDELENGCLKVLREFPLKKTITLTVPGAMEIPFAIRHYWEGTGKKKRPEAFIALGCVIRGDTPHFEYVCQSVTQGITQLNLLLPVPVVFGILTVDQEQQARERIGGLHGHKGEEAAITAMKMITMTRSTKK